MPIFDEGGNRLLTLSQVALTLGVSSSAVSQAVRRGSMSAPVDRVDGRTPLWREDDLVIVDATPAELRCIDRWVSRTSTKVPRTPSGETASVSDASTWCDYGTARAARALPGLVLNGDGVVCLTLEHCLTAKSQSVRYATEFVDWASRRTYVEVNAAGDGLSVWGRASLGKPRRRRYAGGTVELAGTGRYVAITRDRFRQSPLWLADLTEWIELILT